MHNSSLSRSRNVKLSGFQTNMDFLVQEMRGKISISGLTPPAQTETVIEIFAFPFASVPARSFFFSPIIFDVAIKRFSARSAFRLIRRVHTVYLVFCVYVVFTLNAGFQDNGGAAAAAVAVVSLSASYYLLIFFCFFFLSLPLAVN